MARFKVECETGNITFNPSASTDQIILQGLIEINASDVIEITNSVTNKLIYDHTMPGEILTLVWDPVNFENKITISPPNILSGMNPSDELRVYIDYPDKEIPQRVNNIQTGYWAETQMNPIVTATSAYLPEYNIGGINSVFGMCRMNQGTVDLSDVCIWSTDAQVFSGVIDFWADTPTSGTYLDSQPQIMNGDQDYWLGSVSFLHTDFQTLGAPGTGISTLTKAIPGTLKLQNLNAGQDIFYTIRTSTVTGSPNPRYGTIFGLFVKVGWKKA